MKLNTYRLHVTFEDGNYWWLRVLARNMEAVTTFIRPEQEIIIMNVTLLEKDVPHQERDTFLCKILAQEKSKDVNNG